MKNNIRTVPNQKARVIALFLYLVILIITSKIVFGQLLPPATGGKAVWFYTGLASILLGNHLVTPYFSKPVDAISYGVAAVAALYGAEDLAKWNGIEKIVFYSCIIYCTLIIFTAFLSILTRESTDELWNRVSRSATLLASVFGTHRSIFGLTIVVAIYLFHRESWSETFYISLVCLITVLVRPDEIFAGLFAKLKNIWNRSFVPIACGEIAAIQAPNIFLVRQSKDEHVPFGMGLVLTAANRSPFPAIALDTVGRDDSYLVRVLETEEFSSAAHACVKSQYSEMSSNCAANLKLDADSQARLIDPILKSVQQRLVGLVATETSSTKLYFEVVTDQELQEGRLLSVKSQGNTVIYQLLDGLTKEEVVQHKNSYGYIRAEAKKIGVWDTQAKKFEFAPWLPTLNTPVFFAGDVPVENDANVIGHFPGGNFAVRIKSIGDLVTHNTAILGILGVGKTMLAVELVERIMSNKIKVLALDLTDQYSQELSSFYDVTTEAKTRNTLNDIGKAGKKNFQSNKDEGGSVAAYRIALMKDLSEFIDSNDHFLKIYNPNSFEVWKQDSMFFKATDTPSMSRLTPSQITQIVSELCLELLQAKGMSKDAKLCIVYEEAHSLVPEWNSVVADGDKNATSGTARAILQGRKFGMGCLLITQRTANVTKSILNQCNTIFAMRTFDDTGKDFWPTILAEITQKSSPHYRSGMQYFLGKPRVAKIRY